MRGVDATATKTYSCATSNQKAERERVRSKELGADDAKTRYFDDFEFIHVGLGR